MNSRLADGKLLHSQKGVQMDEIHALGFRLIFIVGGIGLLGMLIVVGASVLRDLFASGISESTRRAAGGRRRR